MIAARGAETPDATALDVQAFDRGRASSCCRALQHCLKRSDRRKVAIEPDGTVHMPAQTVPVSGFLSLEGKAYLAEHLRNLQRPEMLVQENGVPRLIAGYIARQRELFAVDREETTIGGVHAYVYTPRDGIAAENRDRVLIDLHGGGFRECWPACAELESMPIAALGRIKVVSLDYRQGPEHRHPAASEDVAAAYRDLLEELSPREHRHLRLLGRRHARPGCRSRGFSAMGCRGPERSAFCAPARRTSSGNAFGGDASYTTLPLGEGRVLRAGGGR